MPEVMQFSESNIQRLFGYEAAEDESPERLQQYYFKSSVYDRIVTDLPIRILVGHKGIGKSALFKISMAEAVDKQILTVLIQPNDILDLAVDTSDILLTIRTWTEGLTNIIITEDPLFSGVETNNLPERKTSQITQFISNTLAGIKTRDYPSEKRDLILRFLETPKISVYIDDLDRGWQGRSQDVTRISALLNALRDLSNSNREVSFKVALRSDVYYFVRTSDESTDKIEGSVVWHTWTNHEIFVLLIKRIETYFGRPVRERELLLSTQRDLARYLKPIMEPKFSGKGHWENAPTYRVLMSLIRKRPRDLVKLCTLAARNAFLRKSSRIQAQDFEAVFEEYSQGRI